MKNKLIITLNLLLAFLICSNLVFASSSSIVLDIKDEPTLNLKLDDNSSFEKKLISKDLSNKTLTFQLQVTNNEPITSLSGELMIVLDTSNSMENFINETTSRKEAVINSAKQLITSLLSTNSNLKIGIVSFATSPDIMQEGTINDATVISNLTNNLDELNNSLSNIVSTGPRTNLQAGLSLAREQFSNNNNNKYMIILTDGVPNVSLDFDLTYYSDSVIENTKNELKKLTEDNITTIAMLTGIDDGTFIPMGQNKTFNELIDEIFNSTTVNKFYYIQDKDIESTITNDIFNDLKPTEKTLKDIKIIDNFTDETINNFNISISSNIEFGTVTNEIENNNSLIWNIPEIKSGQTATLQNTLTLKDNIDNQILDKEFNVTKTTNVTYLDYEQVSDVSTKILLSEPPVTSDIIISYTVLIFALSLTGLIYLFIVKKYIKRDSN